MTNRALRIHSETRLGQIILLRMMIFSLNDDFCEVKSSHIWKTSQAILMMCTKIIMPR